MRIRHTTIILILIVLMFLADGANSILRNMGSDSFRISIYLRLPVQAYFLLLLLRTKSGVRAWLLMLLFFAIFLMGSLTAMTSLYSFEEYDLLGNFRMLNKMLFFFICYEALKQCFRTARERDRLFKVYEVLALAQVVVIIVSFIFDLDIFAAYSRVTDSGVLIKRFGYQGLIPAQNEISAFFVIAFFYFLSKINHLRRGVLVLLMTMVAGVLTGTKVTLVLPAILGMYILAYATDHFVKARTKFSKAYLFIGVTFLFLLIVVVWQRDYFLSRISRTISYYEYQVAHYYSGMRDALLGDRRLQVKVFLSDILPRFSILNYLFGGIDLMTWSTEMDPIDVFARLGLVGGAAFYISYLKALIPALRLRPTRLVFVLTWLGVSSFSGHVAFTAINGLYLAILLLRFSSFRDDGHFQSQSEAGERVLQPGQAS